jgi:hypothetical protein
MDMRLEIATRFIAGFIASFPEDVELPELKHHKKICGAALELADSLIAEHNKTR